MAEVDAKAQALVAKACGWVAANPETWAKLRRICYRLMLEGHVIQRDNVYTLACQNGMTVSEASEFKCFYIVYACVYIFFRNVGSSFVLFKHIRYYFFAAFRFVPGYNIISYIINNVYRT